MADRLAPFNFLKNAAIYGVGSILAQAVSVLLLPLYTNYIPPADLGALELIERTASVVQLCLMAGGIGQAAMAFYAQSTTQPERERVVVAVGTLLAACVGLTFLCAVQGAPALAPWLGIDRPGLLALGLVAVISQLITVLPLTLMQARVEPLGFTLFTLGSSLLRFGLSIWFVAYWGWGLSGVYWAMLLGNLAFGIPCFVREFWGIQWRLDPQLCWEVLAFSFPFLPTSLLVFLLLNADRFWLMHYHGNGSVGIYALAAKLAAPAALIATGPLFKVWTAKMYEVLANPQGPPIAARILKQMMVVYALVGMGLSLFQPEALYLLRAKAYAGAGSAVAPLVLASGFYFMGSFMECGLYVRRKTIYKPLLALAGTLVTLACYHWLIPAYGILGAAVATLLGYAALAGCSYWLANQILPIPYRWAQMAALLMASVVCYLPATAIPLGWPGFVAKIGLLLVWGGLLFLFRVVSLVELRHFFSFEPEPLPGVKADSAPSLPAASPARAVG